MLQANPNLGALWIPEAGSAEGAVAAVLEAKADVVIMHADVTPTTLEHIKAGNIHMALNPNQGMQGYMGFLATFMAAHPDLIDPFNDYKRSGFNPMGIPVHRQRLRRDHQGQCRRLRPQRLHGRPRLSRDRAAPSPRGRRADRRTSPSGAAGAKARIMSDDVVLENLERQQVVRRDPGAARRRLRAAPRRGARHRRRERRGQVDADEHHRRHPAGPTAARSSSNGEPVEITSPARAQELGIGFVHQEIALCPDVTVAENIFMAEINAQPEMVHELSGRCIARRPRGAGASSARSTRRVLVGTLSISSQQLVEIAKALTLDCRILILDEPTAALTEREAQVLFGIMRELAARGISIIYISHRMVEIFDNCDRVSVFRDGRRVVTARRRRHHARTTSSTTWSAGSSASSIRRSSAEAAARRARCSRCAA